MKFAKLAMTFLFFAMFSHLHAQPPAPYDCGQNGWAPALSEGPTRLWQPANTGKGPGIAHLPLQGTLVRVFNQDTYDSSEMALFRLDQGCLRAFKSRSFGGTDLALIHEFRDHTQPALAKDKRVFHTVDFANAFALLKQKKVHLYETQHFAFWWGEAHDKPGAKLLDDPQWIVRAGEWFEVVWQYWDEVLHAPMPFAGVAAPPRLNVSLYQTGLPWRPADSFADSADSMSLTPQAMGFGSHVVPHEFTHVVQFYSHGFRDSPTVGEFWETHANFAAFTFEPTFGDAFPLFMQSLDQGIFYPGARYGNFAFLLQLWEDRRTAPLLFSMWTQGKRDRTGRAIEDPAETLVRLGQASGAFPEGLASFEDAIGLYAARLVAMDFINQQFMLSATERDRNKPVPHLSATSDGWLASLPDRPLYQYGIAHVPLEVKPGATKVTVRLRAQAGGKAALADAGFRLTLVAVDSTHHCRYSPVARASGASQAVATLDVRPGETVTAAIAATPGHYQPIRWGNGYDKLTQTQGYSYALQLTSASAKEAP